LKCLCKVLEYSTKVVCSAHSIGPLYSLHYSGQLKRLFPRDSHSSIFSSPFTACSSPLPRIFKMKPDSVYSLTLLFADFLSLPFADFLCFSLFLYFLSFSRLRNRVWFVSILCFNILAMPKSF
jgi:hypothetical protein